MFFQAKETKAAKTKKAAERVDDSKYELYVNFSCPASREEMDRVGILFSLN